MNYVSLEYRTFFEPSLNVAITTNGLIVEELVLIVNIFPTSASTMNLSVLLVLKAVPLYN